MNARDTVDPDRYRPGNRLRPPSCGTVRHTARGRSLTARSPRAASYDRSGIYALRDMGGARESARAGRPTRPSRGCLPDGARRLPGLCGRSVRQPARSLPLEQFLDVRANPRTGSIPPWIDLRLRYPSRSMTSTAPNVRPFLRFLTDRRTRSSRLLSLVA